MCVRVCVHTCVRTCVCVRAYMHTCIRISVAVCTYVALLVCCVVSVCSCACVYMCAWVHNVAPAMYCYVSIQHCMLRHKQKLRPSNTCSFRQHLSVDLWPHICMVIILYICTYVVILHNMWGPWELYLWWGKCNRREKNILYCWSVNWRWLVRVLFL